MRTHLIPLLLIFFLLPFLSLQAQSELEHKEYQLAEDVLWASPQGFDLSMDIYTPQAGETSYPVLVIFHGGGWLINDHSIMEQMAAYVASHAKYVVCNVNYRLLGDLDNTVTMNQIVEDAMGAVLWIKEHIGKYQGDSTQIALTGDSAGGHLAAIGRLAMALVADSQTKSLFIF
jgi:acetyl esterase